MKKICLILAGFLLLAFVAEAQTHVTGTVLEESGETAIGANVVAEGTTVGTVTDFDGKFEITVPAGVKNLIISYMGYRTEKVPVKPVIKVKLVSDAQQIEEVVVTGYQVIDKRLTTGSTTKVDAEKAKLDGVADISRSLEGRAAGVSVQNVSGTFGTAPKIRMRGATSIYGASKPLWVVDGVVMEDAVEVDAEALSSGDAVTLISSAIAGLNADDIESFQILKDGAATSIYGARAMAGVIVVTTKKGKAGHSQINYTGEFSVRLKPSYNEFNISNSQEQMSIYREMEKKGWLEFANLTKASSSGIYGKMYQLINTYKNGEFGLANTESAKYDYLRKAEYRNTDWFDLLFRNTIVQNHSISISGGTEKARFYTSMSVMYDPGWTLSSDVQRYTVNANASFDITKKLTLTLLTADSYRKQKAPGTLSRDPDVVTGTVKRDFDINPFSYALNASRALDPDEKYTRNYCSFNIFDELDNNYIDLGVTDVKFQGELEYKPIKGLSIKALAAYRYQNSVNEHHVKDNSNQARAYRAGVDPEDETIRSSNPFLYTDPDDENALPETVMPKGGIYFLNQYKMSQFDFRASVSYNTAIKEAHILNIFAGMELNKTDRNAIAFEGYGFCYNDGGTPFTDYHKFKQQVEEGSTYYANSWQYSRSMAFFATATYSYLGRYNFNLTGRYEGSNGLGKSQKARWLPTWNVGFSWNAHEENWWYPTFDRWWTNATAKISYSLTADRCPTGYSYAEPVFTSSTIWRPSAAAQEVGINLAMLGNSELTYEKKYELNVGASLGFIDNRINLDVDAYWRNNFDLIGPTYTTGIGGMSVKYANCATMKSRGVELTLSTVNISDKEVKGFKWTTDFTFSHTDNKITKLDSRTNVLTLVSGLGYAREGYPVRALFSIPFVGLNDEGLPMVINENGKVTVSDINFQEINKTDFLKYEGPTDPPITGGFGNTFSYWGFTLNIFMTYSFGNVVRLDPVFASSYDDMTALPRDFNNRWALPGDEKRTNIPVIASTRQAYTYGSYALSTAYNAYNYSTERIAKGDFIRMKEISLAYELPQKVLANVPLKKVSFKFQVTNPFLIYSDKKLNGQDPEFLNSGGVATPLAKQFTFTVRLGFQ